MKTGFAALAAIGLSALVLTGCGSSGSSSSSSSSTTAGAIDAKQLFVAGDSATGAMACGSCHTLAAAGTNSTVGPNLDKIAKDDNAKALTEMIVDPNAEVVEGYQKNVMPQNYTKTLTTAQIATLAKYIDQNSQHAE